MTRLKPRKAALLLFPDVSHSLPYVQKIATEGYTDLALGLFMDHESADNPFTGQGLNREQFLDLCSWAKSCGLGVIVFTNYMKYREDHVKKHPERSLVCTPGQGNSIDSDGLQAMNWTCPFQQINKDEYKAFLDLLLAIENIREIHLNDEAQTGFSNSTTGCYCDECCKNFKDHHGYSPPRKVDVNDSRWWDWTEHRISSWTRVHSEFRDHIKATRPDISVGIQHNPVMASHASSMSQCGIDLARDGQAQDLLCTDPYHGIHRQLYNFMPHRRYLAEATRSMAAFTVGKSLNIYPQAFQPPSSSLELNERDGALAALVPHCLGAQTITPYTYELQQLIPGFHEGFLESGKIIKRFDGLRPHASVSLLNPTRTFHHGYPGEERSTQLWTWQEIMNRISLPWNWIADTLISESSEIIGGPLVIPDAHVLSKEQQEHIDTHARNGVLWIGQTPAKLPYKITDHLPPTPNLLPGKPQARIVDTHEITQNLDHPIVLEECCNTPPFDGEVILDVQGKPLLVIREYRGKREAWLAGKPVLCHQEPGSHGSIELQTSNMQLMHNLIAWLNGAPPLARLESVTSAYRKIRPWDKRDVPSMELFPLIGDHRLLCIIFNYMGMEYHAQLSLNLPEGLVDLKAMDFTQNQACDVQIHDGIIQLPIHNSKEDLYHAIEISWK